MRTDLRGTVEFGVLGPMSVKVAGTPIEIGAARVRILLASLLLRANIPVVVDELVDRLWGDDPPKGARSALQKYVHRLRNTLGWAGRLVLTEATGYMIDIPHGALDLERFRGHILAAQEAQPAGDLHAEARSLRAGLALWRGRPIADVPSAALQRQEVPRLTEEYLQAVERHIDVDLQLGRHVELISELRGLTAEHPFRERLWFQLMLALYRSHRQADALSAYMQVRRLLREELGLDPTEQLSELHQRILVADQSLLAPLRPSAPAIGWLPPPSQIPPDLADFVGRAELISELRSLTGAGSTVPAVPIVVLSGPPGVGKTALAVHAAHQLRPDFPDGQLYINLRGYASSPPMAPGEALARFLRALGVSPDLASGDIDEMSGLFRSALADRRVLVVLDNAGSTAQVRPLLPGSPHSAVIITSRDNLLSLSVLDGARRIPVDTFSRAEAIALLSRTLGDQRIAAEPAAADTLAALCEDLPLALRIAAANLHALPDQSIALAVHTLSSDSRFKTMALDGPICQAVPLPEPGARLGLRALRRDDPCRDQPN